jgi:hypothetical protein
MVVSVSWAAPRVTSYPRQPPMALEECRPALTTAAKRRPTVQVSVDMAVCPWASWDRPGVACHSKERFRHAACPSKCASASPNLERPAAREGEEEDRASCGVGAEEHAGVNGCGSPQSPRSAHRRSCKIAGVSRLACQQQAASRTCTTRNSPDGNVDHLRRSRQPRTAADHDFHRGTVVAPVMPPSTT